MDLHDMAEEAAKKQAEAEREAFEKALCPVNQGIATGILIKAAKFICDELAELFGSPCNFSPINERMLESKRCADDCGDVDDFECWHRYFITRYNYFVNRLGKAQEQEATDETSDRS